MRIIFGIVLLFTFITDRTYAQINDFKNYFDKGIELYDNGDYKGAIEQYANALKIDSKSALVNYEIAMTYFAIHDYEKAIEHSNQVISKKEDYVDRAYIVKGSALDLMGKTKDAIKTYKKAVKEFPQNHLLYYNLALTSYNIKEYKDAEEALQEALKIKSTHGSSHLLMGYVMSDQGKRPKALLALYNFLLVEPKGARAESALKTLNSLNKRGVSRESGTTINITMSADGKDEFSAAELMLSMLEASKTLDKNKDKTEYELFQENTKSFFSVLGELKKDNKGFWWEYYVDFFYALAESEHMEAFSYYITQARGDDKINTWLADHKTKTEAMLKWVSEYKRKV